ncbi:MAG: NAD-dependent protein deacylase [Porticoccaceae bacterium]|nr:MAG: NAD-dependent protein deacylase [Porticoccaceae bacterium]
MVAITGAGISAESGLPTFRDGGGLWRRYRVEELATPAAWARHPKRVLEFYNERRRAVRAAIPNAAHRALAELERRHEVIVITQNIDDLHERAGSSRVLHLHGEILKARSTVDPDLIYPWEGDLHLGDRCEKGGQLRPHVVWFGEMVLHYERAAREVAGADVVLVVGTSLSVYPAAGLTRLARPTARKILITREIDDPPADFDWLQGSACEWLPRVVSAL